LNVLDKNCLVTDQLPYFVKIFPLGLLAISDFHNDDGSGVQLIVGYEVSVTGFVNIDDAPLEATIFESILESFPKSFAGKSLEFPAGRTTSRSVKIVKDDLLRRLNGRFYCIGIFRGCFLVVYDWRRVSLIGRGLGQRTQLFCD